MLLAAFVTTITITFSNIQEYRFESNISTKTLLTIMCGLVREVAYGVTLWVTTCTWWQGP